MSTVTIDVHGFMQTKQLIRPDSGDEEMQGKVVVDIDIDGKPQGRFDSDVKLVVGGTYEVDAIEVSRPAGYKGSFDQNRFAERIESYVRGAVGRNGWAVRVGPGARGVTMINNFFGRHERFSFPSSSDSAGW